MACAWSMLLQVLIWTAIAAGTDAEFVAQRFLPYSVPCNVSLTSKVFAECRGRVFDQAKYDVWAVNLDFQFGKLSYGSWTSLRDQYTLPWAGPNIRSGQTFVFSAYNSSREYNLLDFLPVNIRALANRNFVEEDNPLPTGQPLPKESEQHVYNKSIMVPNCWTTVYETLRTMGQGCTDNTSVFHDVYSTDDKMMQRWLEDATRPIPGPYDQVSRQLGDIMFIYLDDPTKWRRILEHAVMFIDQDIVWEKAGTGSLNPYRLTSIATVEKEWKPSGAGGFYLWELRRPMICGGRMKSFVEEFSLFSQSRDPRWPQLWQWPLDLQKQYTLGIADTADPKVVDELTLMKVRTYKLCRQTDDSWQPCRWSEEAKRAIDTTFV